MEAAWRWRRDREWDQRALMTAFVLLAAGGGGDHSLVGIFDEVRFALPGYRPDE